MALGLLAYFGWTVLEALVFSLPAVVYAAVAYWHYEFDWTEIRRRLGITVGAARWWLVAVGITVLNVAILIVAVSVDMHVIFVDEHSPLDRFVGLGVGTEAVVAALIYGIIGAGLWEELVFRGLIAGALFRRMRFWLANVIQALIFLAPHLLVLLVEPGLWYWLIPFVTVFGLILGWLRGRSGSFVPAWLVHAAGNSATALMVAAGMV